MKTSITLKIAAAIAAAPLFLVTAALAGQDATTYSRTTQSDLVLHAINSLRSGNVEEFRSMLDESALNLYGNEQSMHDLRDRFERLSAGASTETMNTRTELGGSIKADRILLVSNRVYSVDVLNRTAGDAPIWNVSVHCVGFSPLDSFGMTDNLCRITDISISHQSREGSSESQGFAGVHGRYEGKQLGDDTTAAAAPALMSGTGSNSNAAAGARADNQ